MTLAANRLDVSVARSRRYLRRVSVNIRSIGSGIVCCDVHGWPFEQKVQSGRTGTTKLGATIGPDFGCQETCNGTGTCACGAWPISVDPDLITTMPNGTLHAELEVAGSMWPTTIKGFTNGERCWDATIGSCSATIPAGLSPDHLNLAYVQGERITVVRAETAVGLSPADVLPSIPRQAVFQNTHALAWQPMDVEADATVLTLVPGSPPNTIDNGPWYIVLPPDADRVTLPADPSLPQGFASATLEYLDSDDLDGFSALTAAGIHVERVGPLLSDRGIGDFFSAIVPLPATRLRITTATAL
jgi:hypothetical protein